MSDWDSHVVIGSKGRRPAVAKTESAVNAARRSGVAVDTSSKGVSNKAARGPDHQKIAALDRDDEAKPPATVNPSVGSAMSKARMAVKSADGKSMTQKDLATKVNEKPSVIQDYENGKAIPNPALLAKLERALGVKLRGDPSLIGTPLNKPGSKK
ncbi:mbf1-domain-containing protein [Phaffia rhodozyma]|uniref:Mbf1-domain-containing protein n=1 Tax=Phaffia rhodozyma TaxID=264483 RepID=A0A0F7SQ58_PHARH|nr:mbf1-domain-containing protein [Phaffia rhodozyma]